MAAINSHLPDNILHNILVRLPAKPLLRCRCVSKHWNSLILDPFFIKSRSRPMTILSTSTLDLHIIDHDNMGHSIVNVSSFFGRDQEGNKNVTVVGSFNGIVLLVLSGLSQTTDMILYNPFTRASKKVPDPPYSLNYDASRSIFGLIATPDDDEVKIVKIVSHLYGHWATCHVLDLKKSHVWSTPQDLVLPYEFYETIAGLYLNGFLYWIATNAESETVVILGVNVEEMVFFEIDLPHPCNYDSHIFVPKYLMGSVNGCLCMSSGDLFCNQSDVWVMKEFNSWSKVMCSYNLFSLECSLRYSYIYIMDQGRIVTMDNTNGQLFIYDTSKYLCEPAVNCLEGYDNILRLHGVEYVESLVSPSDIFVAPDI